MAKIKMLFRHGGLIGKMEQGHIYEIPDDYATELINHGLAEIVHDDPPKEIRVLMDEKPIHITAREIGKMRTETGRFRPRAKKE